MGTTQSSEAKTKMVAIQESITKTIENNTTTTSTTIDASNNIKIKLAGIHCIGCDPCLSTYQKLSGTFNIMSEVNDESAIAIRDALEQETSAALAAEFDQESAGTFGNATQDTKSELESISKSIVEKVTERTTLNETITNLSFTNDTDLDFQGAIIECFNGGTGIEVSQDMGIEVLASTIASSYYEQLMETDAVQAVVAENETKSTQKAEDTVAAVSSDVTGMVGGMFSDMTGMVGGIFNPTTMIIIFIVLAAGAYIFFFGMPGGDAPQGGMPMGGMGGMPMGGMGGMPMGMGGMPMGGMGGMPMGGMGGMGRMPYQMGYPQMGMGSPMMGGMMPPGMPFNPYRMR